MNLHELARHTAQEFAKAYGRPPRWLAAAPGRVNVIGEHTDYNDGFVLPMAIERYTVIAADRPATAAPLLRLRSTSPGLDAKLPPMPATPVMEKYGKLDSGGVAIDLRQPLKPWPKGSWVNYPAGVLAGFLARGTDPGPFDALIHSTVPLGGGLSSSAALEVATATLLEAITGKTLDPVEKALLCQKAEHEYAGMPCGIMDQFISVMGQADHLLLLDCRSRQPELVPMTDPSVAVLITNTNVKHELTGGGYAQRRAQCETAAKILGVPSLRSATADALEQAKNKMEEVVYRRARHVIGEIERTVHAAAGIRASNWLTVGQLMYASHRSLREDYEVSCAELDAVVDIAQSVGPSGGVIGCRMTGGGFGGCTVALVETAAVESISRKIAADYKARTGIEATMFVSRPAAGATMLKT